MTNVVLTNLEMTNLVMTIVVMKQATPETRQIVEQATSANGRAMSLWLIPGPGSRLLGCDEVL